MFKLQTAATASMLTTAGFFVAATVGADEAPAPATQPTTTAADEVLLEQTISVHQQSENVCRSRRRAITLRPGI